MGVNDPFDGRPLARSKAERFGRVAPAPTAAPPAEPCAEPAPSIRSSPEAEGRMADITAKPIVHREAVAEGFLRLRAQTLRDMAEGALPKGDPFGPARIAGIMAAKNTPQIVPLCHPIPLTSVEITLTREERGVRCQAIVIAEWKTGVEMEALTAVSGALLTVWDMTKALEKDETGNYPNTAIETVRVIRKTKKGTA